MLNAKPATVPDRCILMNLVRVPSAEAPKGLCVECHDQANSPDFENCLICITGRSSIEPNDSELDTGCT